MFKNLIPLVLFLAVAVLSPAHAQGTAQGAQTFAPEVVTIDRVNFDSPQDDWIRMEIRMTANANPKPDARNNRFIEDIRVKAYLVYTRDQAAREFDFYISEVEIPIMERGDRRHVYFYLPGPIAKRDTLRREPDYYFVEIFFDGVAQEPQVRGMSRSLTPTSLISMKQLADAEASSNEHLLMPVYLAPGNVLGRLDAMPVFLRRDVRN